MTMSTKFARPKLSLRMKIFIEKALENRPFWDLCCDHGHVGFGALESGLFTEVHFVDQLPHIMGRLSCLLEQYKIEGRAPFYLHSLSGEKIPLQVKGTCLIAGVGGLTIKKILEGLQANNNLHAQRLLLSPHTDDKVLLEYISSQPFCERFTLLEQMPLPVGKKIKTLYLLDCI